MSPSLGTKNSFLLDAPKGEESKPQEERDYLAMFSSFQQQQQKQQKKCRKTQREKVQLDRADMSGGSCRTEGRRQSLGRRERGRSGRVQGSGLGRLCPHKRDTGTRRRDPSCSGSETQGRPRAAGRCREAGKKEVAVTLEPGAEGAGTPKQALT